MKRAAWVIVIALWVCIFASSMFTRMEADDYCFAGLVEDVGVVGAVPRMYFGWAGLYTDHLISGLFAAVEPYGTRIGVPLMLASVVVAWWYVFAYWYKRLDALLLALAFGAALAMSRPNDEPIYWLSGITSYWLPIAGVGLMSGALIRKQTTLAALITFLSVALSEFGGALICVGLSLALLTWSGERRRIAICLAAAVLGLTIVVLAPGNQVRAAANASVSGDLGTAVLVMLAEFPASVFVTFAWCAIGGLFLSGVGALFPVPVPARNLRISLLIMLISGLLTLLLLSGFAVGYAPPFRTLYIVSLLWIMVFFVYGVLIGGRFPLWRGLVFVGAILLVGAVQHVVARIDYAQQWDARHDAILAGYRVRGDIGSWDTLTDTEWAMACAEGWYDRDIRFVDVGNVP